MADKHFFNLESLKPQKKYDGGYQTNVTKNEVTTLAAASLSFFKLKKGFIQEPIWHTNAHKIGFCLQGTLLVSILGANFREIFTVTEGEAFFIPKGAVHYFANMGDKECDIVFCLSNNNPEEMHLTKAMRSLSDSVFYENFGMDPTFLENLKKSKKEGDFITPANVKSNYFVNSNCYKFNVNESSALVHVKGGYLKAGTKTNLPVLQDLGMFVFGLYANGIVEPHWHTNAGELIFIQKGKARISILSPDGILHESEVSAGGGAFAPACYFHNIENIGDENVVVIAFFSHAEPDYVGVAEALSFCPPEVLASSFQTSPDYFNTFHSPPVPLIISGGAPKLAKV